MKQRPILFSTPMVQAILAGRKTMTRRVVKIKELQQSMQIGSISPLDKSFLVKSGNTNWEVRCPYGEIGDVLWVRETFCFDGENYIFKPNGKPYRWKPSIFMPKDAARIWLRITNVRVERLQDISRGDSMSEGCPFPNIAKETNPSAWFAGLWQSINGEDSWNDNPWVWVIEFERIEKPIE